MTASSVPLLVMPGLDPGIHPGHILRRVAAEFCARDPLGGRDVDGRNTPGLDPGAGHDGKRLVPLVRSSGAGP